MAINSLNRRDDFKIKRANAAKYFEIGRIFYWFLIIVIMRKAGDHIIKGKS